MFVQAPPGVRACHVQCEFAATSVRLGLAGNPPYLQASHAPRTRRGAASRERPDAGRVAARRQDVGVRVDTRGACWLVSVLPLPSPELRDGGDRGRRRTPHAAKVGAGVCGGRRRDNSSCSLAHAPVQGKTWECFCLGHAALDALTGEKDRKRILLERFQAEVRPPVALHSRTRRAHGAAPQTPGFDFSGAELSGAARDASTFMR